MGQSGAFGIASKGHQTFVVRNRSNPQSPSGGPPETRGVVRGSGSGSANHAAGIPVLDTLARVSRPPPHSQVMPEEKAPLGILLATDAGEVQPRNRGMAMVRPVPVVVQPEPINRREKPVVIPKGWSYVSPGCSDARGTSVAKPWGTSWK